MNRIIAAVVMVIAAACDGGPAGNMDGGRTDGTVPRNDARIADGGMPDRPDPVFPEDHPRVYLSSEAVRTGLNASLEAGDPAATRFRDLVDAVLGGKDSYDYQAWYGAMLGQLTGEAQYCTDSVQRVDAWVASEEAMIEAGGEP